MADLFHFLNISTACPSVLTGHFQFAARGFCNLNMVNIALGSNVSTESGALTADKMFGPISHLNWETISVFHFVYEIVIGGKTGRLAFNCPTFTLTRARLNLTWMLNLEKSDSGFFCNSGQ